MSENPTSSSRFASRIPLFVVGMRSIPFAGGGRLFPEYLTQIEQQTNPA
jgi:hypothetical protein